MNRMFAGASSFNGQGVLNFDISSVISMWRMFLAAWSFNQDLCSWQDNFPYTEAADIFTYSGCTYKDTPKETQQGPFCASDCQSPQVVSCGVSSYYFVQVDNPFLFTDAISFSVSSSQLLVLLFQ